MKIETNKDLVFVITVILWICCNFIGFAINGQIGSMISNFSWMMILIIMILTKNNYKPFNIWLERKYGRNR